MVSTSGSVPPEQHGDRRGHHVYAPGRNDDDLCSELRVQFQPRSCRSSRLAWRAASATRRCAGLCTAIFLPGMCLNGERLSKDPDQQVQASIEGVFRAFLEAGSARAAAQLLRGSGVRFSGLQTWSGELAGCGLRPYSGDSEEPDDGRRLCWPARAGRWTGRFASNGGCGSRTIMRRMWICRAGTGSRNSCSATRGSGLRTVVRCAKAQRCCRVWRCVATAAAR